MRIMIGCVWNRLNSFFVVYTCKRKAGSQSPQRFRNERKGFPGVPRGTERALRSSFKSHI